MAAAFEAAGGEPTALLAVAHGRALRMLCLLLKSHYSGLAAAARAARQRGEISNAMAKRLVTLDNAYAFVRHVSVPMVEDFIAKLDSEIRQVADTGQHSFYIGDTDDDAASTGPEDSPDDFRQLVVAVFDEVLNEVPGDEAMCEGDADVAAGGRPTAALLPLKATACSGSQTQMGLLNMRVMALQTCDKGTDPPCSFGRGKDMQLLVTSFVRWRSTWQRKKLLQQAYSMQEARTRQLGGAALHSWRAAVRTRLCSTALPPVQRTLHEAKEKVAKAKAGLAKLKAMEATSRAGLAKLKAKEATAAEAVVTAEAARDKLAKH